MTRPVKYQARLYAPYTDGSHFIMFVEQFDDPWKCRDDAEAHRDPTWGPQHVEVIVVFPAPEGENDNAVAVAA